MGACGLGSWFLRVGVLEQGAHEALVALGGLYSELFQLQTAAPEVEWGLDRVQPSQA